MKQLVVLGFISTVVLAGTSPAFAGFSLIQGDNSWSIDPIQVATKDAKTFYGYRNPYRWSGNNVLFEHLNSKLYLYGDPDGTMNLIMHHSMRNRIDNPRYWIRVGFEFDGTPAGTTVALADDRGEMTLSGGRWRFHNNSDGGILSNLSTTTNWCMTITPRFDSLIESWDYVNFGGRHIGLNLDEEIKICHRVGPPDSPPAVPTPGALLLSAVGTTLIGWKRKRRV